MSKGRVFIPQIDGLRFIAIMAVIAYHVQAITGYHFSVDSDVPPGSGLISQIFGAGHEGVELFFAISGFILGMPFARHYLQGAPPVSLGAYYLRRVTRLEPPYLIHLVFLFVATALVLRFVPRHAEIYHQPDWLAYTIQHLAFSVIYANGLILHQYPWPNIVLWSLEIEIQFYLLAPFLARLFQIGSPVLRRLLLVALIIFFSLPGHYVTVPNFLQHSLLTSLCFFQAPAFSFAIFSLAGLPADHGRPLRLGPALSRRIK